METGELNLKSICNTGNIVIDSLISYWGEEAKKRGISFLQILIYLCRWDLKEQI